MNTWRITALTIGLGLLAGSTCVPQVLAQTHLQPEAAGVFYTAKTAAVVETFDRQARQATGQQSHYAYGGHRVKDLGQLKPGDRVNTVQTVTMRDLATVRRLRTLKVGDPIDVTYTQGCGH